MRSQIVLAMVAALTFGCGQKPDPLDLIGHFSVYPTIPMRIATNMSVDFTLTVPGQLIGRQPVLGHQRSVFMTAPARGRNVSRVHLASRIFRPQDGVHLMTIGTGGCVPIPLLQQKLPVPARTQLSYLSGRPSVLPHLIWIRVAGTAQLDDLALIRHTHKRSAMRLGRFEGSWIPTMALIAMNAALRMDAHRESPALVCVADDAAVARVLRARPDRAGLIQHEHRSI